MTTHPPTDRERPMCDSGTNDKKVKVFKVFRPDCGGQHWITRDWATIQDGEFEDGEPGDRIIIELAEMTEDQIEKLPEFEGW